MSDAELLIGSELQVPSTDRADLEAGWTYVSDPSAVAPTTVARSACIKTFSPAFAAPLLIVGQRGKKPTSLRRRYLKA
jgi:hypothetical protein